ncbi:MAG TPA: AAA family ATPase [Pyrinomonadaceae bacterium]
MSDIAEAKGKLPLPALMHRLGLGAHAKKSAHCPFHDDGRKSFSIYKNGKKEWRFKCFAGCGEGDEITFLEKHDGMSNKEATKLFLELAGVNGSTPSASKTRSTSTLDWRACVEAFTTKHIERLAEWRGYSREFCSWLKSSALVGVFNGYIAFPIHDGTGKVVAGHYREKDGDWKRYPIGFKTRPIIIGELLPGEPIHIFESQWDAFAFMDKSGERTGIIITLGSENGKLVARLIPAGTTVYAWKQNDELKNGKRAGDTWLKEVAAHAGTKVLWPKTPEQFKDLNDWTRAGASADDLFTTMMNAEVIRERYKSWSDALNESVVTSSELRQLRLTPRRKLLGDWFCEGDLGFIFAFRGVGKTWLALAIAQALSTGSKLGDWQAHAPVKVLYVDGEMPPDLMRDRCAGLAAINVDLRAMWSETTT